MFWGTAAAIIFSGAIAQLRFLCLSQNNSYRLPCGRAVLSFYIPFSFGLILSFVLTVFSATVNYEFIYAAISVSYLALVILLVKNILYRTKFKLTNRGKKYIIICEFTYFLIVIFIILLVKNTIIMVLSLYPVIMSIPLIIKVIEIPLNCYYHKKNNKFIYSQKNRLEQLKPIVIGITGSYGKTSCKKILEFLLFEKFCVTTTEKNFNTPLGVALSVEKLTGSEQIFIAEFGARKVGDIDELCNLFPPDYGILTGVCEQHLESFGTAENIYKEKVKLALSVAQRGGTCVFNINDKNVFKMWREHRGKKISAGSYKKGDVYASEIELMYNGSAFILNFGNDKYLCKTKLLGRHNIQNIVMCAAMARELGCSPDEIVKRIELLQPIEHRLEYIYANGVHILDDAYNANTYGVKSSLEMLKLFPGRHIVVSQGIVELGSISSRINEAIGEELSEVSDIVILCGPNSKFILLGLKNKNYAGRIIRAKNFKEVQKIISCTVKKGDTLLLQNDIPDIY